MFSGLLVATDIPDHPSLSKYDEWVYLDYVDKVGRLDIPQRGEFIDREALAVSSCRGVFVWGPMGSSCGGPYTSAEYPMAGVTSADIHPPTYFAANAAIARSVRIVGLSGDILTSNRMVGALWLFLGLGLLVMLAMDLGAPLWSAVGAAGVIAALPIIRDTNSYITPDALNVAIGAAVLLTAVRYARGVWPWWALVAIGALAGAIKTQNGLAVGAAAVFLTWCAVSSHGAKGRVTRQMWGAAGMVGGFLVTQVGWLVVRSLIAVGDRPDQGVAVPLTFDLMTKESMAFVLRLGLGELTPVPTFAVLSTAVLIAGCIGALFYRRVADEAWGMAAAVTLLVFIGSPILLVAEYVGLGEVVPSPTRYGASLLAGIGAVTATAFPTRVRSAGFAAVGTGMVALVVVDALVN